MRLRACVCGRCDPSPISMTVRVFCGIDPDIFPRFGATYETGGVQVFRITNSGNREFDAYLKKTTDYSWCDVTNTPQTATLITEFSRWYPGSFARLSLTTSCDGLVYEYTLAKDGTETSYQNPAVIQPDGNVIPGISPCLLPSGPPAAAFGNPAYMTDCSGGPFSGYTVTDTNVLATLRVVQFIKGGVTIATQTETLSEYYTAFDLRADLQDVLNAFNLLAISVTPQTFNVGLIGSATPMTFGEEGEADTWVLTLSPHKSGELVAGRRFQIDGSNTGLSYPSATIEPILLCRLAPGGIALSNLGTGPPLTPIGAYFYYGGSSGFDVGGALGVQITGVLAQKSWITDRTPMGNLVFFPQEYDLDPYFVRSYTTCGSIQDQFGHISPLPTPMCVGTYPIAVGGQELAMPPTNGLYFMQDLGQMLCTNPCPP